MEILVGLAPTRPGNFNDRGRDAARRYTFGGNRKSDIHRGYIEQSPSAITGRDRKSVLES